MLSDYNVTSYQCELVTYGFVRENCVEYVPNDITHKIYSFYDKNAFSLYDKNGNCIKQYCSYFKTNGQALLLLNNFDNLLVSYKTYKGIFFNKQIQLISHGTTNKYTFIYTQKERLYRYESNRFASPILYQHNFGSQIRQIECGDRHSLFLSQKGNVYGCGANDSGQLTKFYKGNNMDDDFSIYKIMDTQDIIQIGCSDNTSFVLTKDNKLYSFGSNKYGVLGINDNGISEVDILTPILKNNKILSFGCGWNYFGCITIKGVLYMFGNNISYQCGINKPRECYKGHKIKMDNLVDIKCGNHHTRLKTYGNEYYLFGSNDKKQLLTLKRYVTPTMLDLSYVMKLTKSIKSIIDLYPCFDNTLIVQQH